MKLLLRHGTRAEFEAAGDQRFTNADTVLVTDPPALRSFATDRAEWTEAALERDCETDVSSYAETEVRRDGGDLIVRFAGKAWRAANADPVHAVFPVLLGVRPVFKGHLTV